MANKEPEKGKEAWWQPALVIFSQVSGWIIVPILIALFVGRALDDKYGTEPWIFLGLTIIAFGISCLGIVLITAKYTKKIEKELQEKKLHKEDNKEKQKFNQD
ncbi:AtpZ/AtpI family protein [Patescibacteria group bacterium]|nr:AtpZ/AtpI family protein [Patescibacteria group bacterium]